jgi:phosphoribosylformimino-5-aminoimidazole carboxamide ribotide isomerase
MKNVPIIPAIDIIDGKLVRLTKGDYAQVEHYAFSPVEMAIQYEAHGAKRIHIVDLDGAKAGKVVNARLISEIRKSVSCTLEIGGGIRNKTSIQELLDLGIDSIILGSILIKEPQLSIELINSFPQKIIAGIDSKNNMVATQGWTQSSSTTTSALIESLNQLPLESIIFTDIDRDGTLEGPNLEAILDVCNISKHPIIASGGVGSEKDMLALNQLNQSNLLGCIVGKAILQGLIPMSALRN